MINKQEYKIRVTHPVTRIFLGSMRHSILTVTPTSTASSTTDERSKSRAKTCLVMHCKEEEDRRSTTKQDARQLRASANVRVQGDGRVLQICRLQGCQRLSDEEETNGI